MRLICNQECGSFLENFHKSSLLINSLYCIKHVNSLCKGSLIGPEIWTHIRDVVLAHHKSTSSAARYWNTHSPHCFNKSRPARFFSDIIKRTIIVPIHKKAPITAARNYQHITTFPTIAKVFEKVVLEIIRPSTLQYLSPRQHGLMWGRS